MGLKSKISFYSHFSFGNPSAEMLGGFVIDNIGYSWLKDIVYTGYFYKITGRHSSTVWMRINVNIVT